MLDHSLFWDDGGRLRALALWCAAAAVVTFGHLACAYALIDWRKPPVSTGDPPASILIDLAPLPPTGRQSPDPQAPDRQTRDSSAPNRGRRDDAVAATDDSVGNDPPSVRMPAAASADAKPKSKTQRLKKTATAKAASARKQKSIPAPVEPAANASAQSARSSTATFGSAAAPSEIPSSWKSRLLAHLDRFKHYPEAARSARQEGVSLLCFTMDREGKVLDVFIARSSGSPALDAETLAMVERATPLPSIPPEVSGDTLELTVPVRFSVR